MTSGSDRAPSPEARAAAAADQLVDVLDEDGTVIGRATRGEVRAGNLLHRSVFVVVVTSLDELVVHKRADWKALTVETSRDAHASATDWVGAGQYNAIVGDSAQVRRVKFS